MPQPDESAPDDTAAQINAAVQAAIAGGGGVELPPLLGGVPEGFATEQPAPPPYAAGLTVPSPARYRQGDEFNPAGWSAERRARMQRQLSAVGLLRGAYKSEFWGPASIEAYKKLLALANTQGLEDAAMLRMLASDPELRDTVAPEAEFEAEPYLRPDPARLASDVRASMASLLGREPTDAEMGQLARQLEQEHHSAYQAAVDAQRAQFDADQAGVAGPGVVQAVDPAARLSEMLRTKYRPEIEMRQRALDLSQSRENLLANVFNLDRQIRA